MLSKHSRHSGYHRYGKSDILRPEPLRLYLSVDLPLSIQFLAKYFPVTNTFHYYILIFLYIMVIFLIYFKSICLCILFVSFDKNFQIPASFRNNYHIFYFAKNPTILDILLLLLTLPQAGGQTHNFSHWHFYANTGGLQNRASPFLCHG